MPRGRGFWGPGYGMGRGFWGFGRGMGNPYPNCRFFPWLPRRWWTGMYGPISPYGGTYGSMSNLSPYYYRPYF